MSFEELGIRAGLLRALSARDITSPTPIQSRAIPIVLQGQDIQAAAQTGTGKTAAFALPLLQRLADEATDSTSRRHPRVLVVTPTRELAAQVSEEFQYFGKRLRLRTVAVFGGVNINRQINELGSDVDVLVATPGRLLDLCNQRAVRLDTVQTLVLDEADRMLDMGFAPDVRRIIAKLPERQTLLFSATYSKEIRALARNILRDPAIVQVAPENSAAGTVSQVAYQCLQAEKRPLLLHLLRDNDWFQVLVFSRTKHGANRLATQLVRSGVEAMAIHGNKSQSARTRALKAFKSGEVRVLVATDIAARGLDIPEIDVVINFELPQVPEDYVHRIGRTGRAGHTGHAIALVNAEEERLLNAIEKQMNQSVERVSWQGASTKEVGPADERAEERRNEPQPQKVNKRRNRRWRPRKKNAGQQAA